MTKPIEIADTVLTAPWRLARSTQALLLQMPWDQSGRLPNRLRGWLRRRGARMEWSMGLVYIGAGPQAAGAPDGWSGGFWRVTPTTIEADLVDWCLKAAADLALRAAAAQSATEAAADAARTKRLAGLSSAEKVFRNYAGPYRLRFERADGWVVVDVLDIHGRHVAELRRGTLQPTAVATCGETELAFEPCAARALLHALGRAAQRHRAALISSLASATRDLGDAVDLLAADLPEARRLLGADQIAATLTILARESARLRMLSTATQGDPE